MLRYLGGTITQGLILAPYNPLHKSSLRAYRDSDWASDSDDMRSTSGSCVYFKLNLVSWSSKKQSLVARSNTETEYKALEHTTYEVLWKYSLLNELHISYLPLALLYDNLSAIMFSHNPILHVCTKHIKLDIHFVRERVDVKRLQIQHIPAYTHISHILTKPLPTNLFISFLDKLKVTSFKPP